MDKEAEKKIRNQLIKETCNIMEINMKLKIEIEQIRKENSKLAKNNLELKNLIKTKNS